MLKKFIYALVLLIYSVSFAQTPPQPPVGGGSGDINTPGAPSTPIDEYTIYLIGFAIALAVVFFAVNKYKKSLI
ncbi:hypothetical protein OBK16_03685 [Empedobacter falsenii]